MRNEDFSRIIGNIDGRLIEEAGPLRSDRKGEIITLKKIVAVAVILVLMLCSGIVGAMAFSREVPTEQETAEFEEIELTLILPDDWKGRYAVEKNEDGYVVYSPEIRENFEEYSGMKDCGGMLFYIVDTGEPLTESQVTAEDSEWNFAGSKYLFATKDTTYILYYASDLQFTAEMQDEYRQLEEGIKDISVIKNGLLND